MQSFVVIMRTHNFYKSFPRKVIHPAVRFLSPTLGALSLAVCWGATPLFAQDAPSGSATTKLPEVTVSSTPLEMTSFESAQPVTVLSGAELQAKPQSSLGAMLSGELGISSTGFGPGAGRPIIRGLGGDRVRILENGVGTQDASNTSPDHMVTVDPSTIEKIEVLRGPAALLYGTSAVGGVVNVFDNRIPTELPGGPVSGRGEIRGGLVDKERAANISLNAPVGTFAFHFDGSMRRTDDIDIPGFARSARLRERSPSENGEEPRNFLPYSATETDNFTLGTSLIRESGFLGVAVSELNSTYGVPNGEENISIDARRRRADLRGKAYEPVDGIKAMELKIGVVDYEHTEFEGSEPGTFFKNQGLDSRYEITHEEIAGVKGIVGTQFQYNDFEAIGEEAFQPPSITSSGSLFIFEEYAVNERLKLQAGLRGDYHDIQATGFVPADSDVAQDLGRNFLTFSQSTGAVWTPVENYAVALSIAHTERAPSSQELFADGPHVATGAFELGDPTLDKERSLGIDLTLRKKSGRITGSLGGYYNHFYNYIGLLPTGETIDDLPAYSFREVAANFYGIESQIAYHFLENYEHGEDFSIDFQPDYTWADDLTNNSPLPRIPPLRLRVGANYSIANLFTSRLELQQVFKQSRTASDETDTDGYTFLNAMISRDITIDSTPFTVFLRGNNLLNEKAREHTSFIKDVAPLPGMNVTTGVQVRF